MKLSKTIHTIVALSTIVTGIISLPKQAKSTFNYEVSKLSNGTDIFDFEAILGGILIDNLTITKHPTAPHSTLSLTFTLPTCSLGTYLVGDMQVSYEPTFSNDVISNYTVYESPAGGFDENKTLTMSFPTLKDVHNQFGMATVRHNIRCEDPN